MKKLTVCLFLAFIALSRGGLVWASIDVERMVEAIGRAENSTKYPYGVKSIDTRGDVTYARKICRNSVVNNLARWKKAGKPDSFIAFMGARYAPTKGAADDPRGLNNNWERNVTYHYNKGRA